jgi:hypothetical protein
MARMLMRVAKVVAAGLVLGSCAAASPWPEWRETAMLLDAPAYTEASSAYPDARIVRAEQLFDD